jgi:hypothetical protein
MLCLAFWGAEGSKSITRGFDVEASRRFDSAALRASIVGDRKRSCAFFAQIGFGFRRADTHPVSGSSQRRGASYTASKPYGRSTLGEDVLALLLESV